MENVSYKALVTEEYEPNKFRRGIEQLETKDLPEGDVTIRVEYSSLNYKDALSARGHKGITRNYPFTPGIDAAGVVADSSTSDYKIGQKVLVTGYDLGMNTPGGFGRYVRVPAEWVVPLPKSLTLRESMAYGTAGFTAAICVDEFRRHDITPDKGKILVTGATGGVAIHAIAILSKLGYEVEASTGKLDRADFVTRAGAARILPRERAIDSSGRPLLKGNWIGVVETVGGETLSSAIRSVGMHGAVCCLGNVAGDKFESSVYPFILRGIYLIGIDSAEKSKSLRLKLWEKLAGDWKSKYLDEVATDCSLSELSAEIDRILQGGQIGRKVLKHEI